VSDQTIDRTELPIRRPPFRGVVQRTPGGSEPDWGYVAPLSPPEGAPNILLILTDDAGLGKVGKACEISALRQPSSGRRTES
jgi:arylsulfatase